MPRYAALLRGINVGGKKKIAMAELRDLLSGLGFTDVQTHLQSGNAVFTSERTDQDVLAEEIENGLLDRFGLAVRCLVREGQALRDTVVSNPLAGPGVDGARLIVVFLSDTPDPALVERHDPRALAPGQIYLGDRVIYQWCPDGILAAPDTSTFVQKHWKLTVTARNWNTVSKLAELLEARRGLNEPPSA